MVYGAYQLATPDRTGRTSRCARRNLRLFCAQLGFLFFASFTVAAAPDFTSARWGKFADSAFRHFTVDQGLPVPTVTALAQDGAGFIWVGTQGGLARFDGYRFKTFKPDPGNLAALPDSYVWTLHTDAAGRLWIGTIAGGLARVEGEHFIVYTPKQGGLSGISVRAIEDDGAGGIWVATEGGLDHLNAAGKILPRSKADVTNTPADIQTLLLDRNGTLWVGTRAGLFRHDVDSNSFVPIAFARMRDQLLSISALFEDEAGRLWIGTARNGVFLKDPAPGPPRPVLQSDADKNAFANASVSVIVSAGLHEVWIGTYGLGIIVVDTRSLKAHRLYHEPTLNSSLMQDDIWALLLDRAGTLWVGNGYGLEQLLNDSSAVLTLFAGYDLPRDEGGSDFSAVHASADGRVWIGTRNGTVDIFDPMHGRVARLSPDPLHPEHALPAAYIRSFAEAGSSIYIGTNRGLYKADLEARHVGRVHVPGRNDTALVDALCANAGVLWIAGHRGGVYALPLTTEAKPVVTHLDASALTDARVSDLVCGHGKYLWIATYNGLNRLDLVSGKVEQIRPDPASSNAFPAGVVTTLLMDHAGRLWTGMFGGGIVVIQEAGDTWQYRQITAAEGLPNNNVDMLLEDQAGRIWVSTENGLAVIDPAASYSVRALHKADGAVISTYWAGSGAVTHQGEVVFGGYGGITVVRPKQYTAWAYSSPIVVTDIKVGGRNVEWNPNGPKPVQAISIPAAANKFSVEYAALDYTAPERNRYAYRLEGFDPEWIETDALRRSAAYTNLQPGDYTLHLRGSNRNGMWNEKILSLPITVEAAWYQTIVFKLLVVLVILTAIAVFVQTRTNYLRRRQLHLEQEIRTRTAEVIREKTAVKKLEQAEKVQRALYTIADLTTSSIERREMLQRMHRIVDYLMYAENFYIALYDENRKTLRFIYFADVQDTAVFDPEHEIPEEELINTATLQLIRRGEPLRGSSEAIRLQLGIAPGQDYGPEANAWLGVPMIAAGEVRGAIVVQSYNKDIQYTEADQELLFFVAEHILTALLRREAKEELEKQVASRTRELALANEDLTNEIHKREVGERLQSVLYRIAELSSISGNVSEYINSVHSEIGKLLYAHNFYVGLLVDDGTALEYPYAVDEYDPGALFQRDKLGRGLTEYVLRTGKPLLALPETIDALIQAGEVERTGTPSVCWLGVPLLFGDQVAGVLVVQSYTQGVVYSDRDQQLLTFVSQHIATALQRRQA